MRLPVIAACFVLCLIALKAFSVNEYEVIDGLVVWDGDMVLGTPQEFAPARGKKPGIRREAVATVGQRLWPEGIVPYVVDPEFADSKVHEAILHWEEKTPIRFVERTDQPNWLHFVTAEDGPCRANLGMIGGEQKVWLPRSCGQSVYVVVHEIGHAVGLLHEQQRNDRDLHVWIQPTAIEVYPRTFPKHGLEALNYGPYDYGSVMHYTFTGTLQTIPRGISQGSNYGLSDGDIDGVRRLYGEIPEQTTISTNPPGLLVEVDGESYTAPHSFDWTPGTVHTIGVRSSPQVDRYSHRYQKIFRWSLARYVFAKWSDEGSQTHSVTASADNTIFTANFIPQNKGEVYASPPHGGTVRIEPPSPDNFYTVFSVARIFAEPAEGFHFERWNPGSTLHGSGYSSNPITTGISNTTTAVFTQKPLTRLDTNAPDSLVLVDGQQARLPANFAWEPGSTHTIEVPEFHYGGRPTTRREFQGWSDGSKGSRQNFPLEFVSEIGFAREITASIQASTITANFTEHAHEIIDDVSERATISFAMPSWSHITYPGTTFIAPQGENPAPQTLEIRNSGMGTLEYQITTDQAWLSVTPNSGSVTEEPDTIRIDVQSANLKQSAFDGKIEITAPAAVPVSIPVKLLVTQGKALDFTHFVNGEGSSSDLVFVNVGDDPNSPSVYFYDTQGFPIAADSLVDITGNLQVTEDGALTVINEIGRLREFTISTHGRGEIVTGSVKVILSGPIGAMLRYNLVGYPEAALGPSEALGEVAIPVRHMEGGITTGIALHNLEATTEMVWCALSGKGLGVDSVIVTLQGNSQVSWLIESLFPNFIRSNFEGLFHCRGQGREWRFTAIGLEMDPVSRTFIVLPVFPIQRGRPGS